MTLDEFLKLPGCKIRRWTVTVSGWGDGDYLASSRGKAMSAAWSCDAFGNMSFKDFLKIARCRLSLHQVKPKPVLCSGEPAWEIERNSNRVTIALPNVDCVYFSHPLDIREVQP